MRSIFLTLLWLVLCACSGSIPEPGDEQGLNGEGSISADAYASLDLREANVVDVTYDVDTSQFGVTLLHDDDGEEGYADWWQVETLDGELLGRRELTHRHDNNPFTRYATISDLQDIEYVVVRGHDQDHGYGGQTMVLNLVTGEQEKIQQGSDEVDFTDYLSEN